MSAECKKKKSDCFLSFFTFLFYSGYSVDKWSVVASFSASVSLFFKHLQLLFLFFQCLTLAKSIFVLCRVSPSKWFERIVCASTTKHFLIDCIGFNSARNEFFSVHSFEDICNTIKPRAALKVLAKINCKNIVV